jgi:hypothetical protein
MIASQPNVEPVKPDHGRKCQAQRSFSRPVFAGMTGMVLLFLMKKIVSTM